MGYKVLYDNQLLFDPYTDDRITDTKLSSKLNAASYFDFTIAPTHSLYSKLKERAGEVRIYFNNLILFKGEITKIDEDFEGNYSVSCTGVLDYLTATRVRPYSTIEGEQPIKAPSSFDGYFQWLIDQHNSNCLDSRKHFSVGVNQGNMLDKNNYIYRSSEQRPTTASEIEDKILNSAGGYLFVRYQDDLNILDLYADVHDVNTQIIDYGVNMLDFTKTTTAENQYTAVVATGYTPNPPEGQPDAKMKPITLEGCTDGGTPYSSTIVKMGDRVYDVNAVNRYGYHEYYVSNTDITTYDGLLYYACKTLNTLLSPALTISVKAVDLALIMGNKYKHLQLGQAVRIRSKPRKVDEYLMVNSIDLDLMNPENTTFDLGASYDTLTGQQSAYLKALNASINASLDTVSALDDNVKNSAKLAQEAKDKADAATDAATDAASKADTAKDTANSAVNKAEDASSKADTAISTSNDTKTKVTIIEKQATEAKTSADTAKKAADDAATAANSAQSSAEKANEAASNANAAASNAQSTADSALSSATQANKDVSNVKTQITEINKEMTSVKQDAATLRDDLTGQITTVKDTMEADYTKKSELSATESNLKTEISKSAAGLRTEVSQTYSTKKELETTDAKVTNLSNKVEKDYATKSSVTQLSDRIDQTVSSVEEVRTDASAAKTTADTANSTANAVKNDLANNYSTTTEMQSSINQTAESIKTTVSKEYTKITDAEAKYATKTSLTQTANDLTIDFDNKINNINKYVRFVDGNVVLGEDGNPTTLKISNDHLDILNNSDVVAKFAESAIELGNNSKQSEVKLCKGLGSIRGTIFGEGDSDPIIEITTSSGVNLTANREINTGHFSMGSFNVLTSSDGTNNEAMMVSESYLRGDNSSVMKDAAISVYTSSSTGDSVCRITSSKIQINGYDAFRLTKLWSGNLVRGGSVNVIQGNQYTLFAVRPGGDGVLMVGVKYANELHCCASIDSGSFTGQYRASFKISDNTFKLVAASGNILNGANNGYTVTEIYGIL